MGERGTDCKWKRNPRLYAVLASPFLVGVDDLNVGKRAVVI